MRKKYSKLFLNSKKESKVGFYQKFKLFINKNKGFIYRIIIFIALILFSELLMFRRVSWRFQIQFYIVFFAVWIGVGEFFLGKNKMFKLHPTNFWAAFFNAAHFQYCFESSSIQIYQYICPNCYSKYVNRYITYRLFFRDNICINVFSFFSVFYLDMI